MIALAAALVVALVPQDESRLKESWPKLVEAWKAVDEYKPPAEAGVLDDEMLKALGKLHQAFEAAGLFAPEGEYVPLALKAFLKQRGRALTAGMSSDWNRLNVLRRRIRIVGGGGAPGAPAAPEAPSVEVDPMGALLNSLRKLKSLKAEGLDDEENVQDEVVTARKALKVLGVTADDTPPALKRRAFALVRALAMGDAYPEPAVATADQLKQVRAWIAELGNESLEIRDKAMKELLRAGEASLPVVRESLKEGDAEVVARCRQLLGFGHAPWKAVVAPRGDALGDFEVILAAPAAVPAPVAPKEEKK